MSVDFLGGVRGRVGRDVYGGAGGRQRGWEARGSSSRSGVGLVGPVLGPLGRDGGVGRDGPSAVGSNSTRVSPRAVLDTGTL